MPALTRRTRVILALVAFAAALAAWQGLAAAAITTTSATLDDVTSTSSPPGGVIPAQVKAKVDAPSTWRATAVQFGSQSPICVDHDNVGAGLVTRTRDFSVTAPGTPGEYDVRFTPNESDNC